MANWVALARLCPWAHLWEQPLAAVHRGKPLPRSFAAMDLRPPAALRWWPVPCWLRPPWPWGCGPWGSLSVVPGLFSKGLEERWWENDCGVLAGHPGSVQQGGDRRCSSWSLQQPPSWWWLGKQGLQGLLLQQETLCCSLFQEPPFRWEGPQSHLQHSKHTLKWDLKVGEEAPGSGLKMGLRPLSHA